MIDPLIKLISYETWAERLNSFPGISVMMIIVLLIGNIQVVFMKNTWQWHFGVSLFVFAVWVSVVIAMLLNHNKKSIPVYKHLGIFQVPLSMFLCLCIVETPFFAWASLVGAQNIWAYYPLMLVATASMIVVTMIFLGVIAFFVIILSPKGDS